MEESAMKSRPALSAYAFSTDFGWMAIAWADERLFGLTFGHPSKTTAQSTLDRILCSDHNCSHKMQRASTAGAEDLIDRLRNFAAGEPVDFDEVEVDTSHLTPFGQRVTAACREIPRGETRTYGSLATECRRPGAARAVGQIMAKNRFPLVVPCHRVVGASGSLGGFSAPQGLCMKRRLLDMEKLANLIGT
jgi:methylated-DNA-[protein]-cysteine S-methyltransferase